MLNTIFKHLPKKIVKSTIKRYISNTNKLNYAYSGEGATTVSILNNESELGLMVNGISEVGFRLNNDITVLGPMILFQRSVLSWTIKSIEDVNDESLSLFRVLEPRPDILVVGVGDRLDNFNVVKPILEFSRKIKLPIEILPTEQACSTFNFLCSEGRYVGGAFIPPTHIEYNEDDQMKSKMRYENLYEVD